MLISLNLLAMKILWPDEADMHVPQERKTHVGFGSVNDIMPHALHKRKENKERNKLLSELQNT